MSVKIFVTGTNTGVGKTIISAGICHSLCLKNSKETVQYIKPFATGVDPVNEDLEFVKNQNNGFTNFNGCGLVELKKPASPHIAALAENTEIDILKIMDICKQLLAKSSNCVIEGAGGLMVPLTKDSFVIDFIKDLGVPVLLTAHYGLGTINHTTLSIEALRSRGIKVAGVVLNQSDDVDEKVYEDAVKSNAFEIERINQVKVLGPVQYNEATNSPVFDLITKELSES